jgi:hypothetical protein
VRLRLPKHKEEQDERLPEIHSADIESHGHIGSGCLCCRASICRPICHAFIRVTDCCFNRNASIKPDPVAGRYSYTYLYRYASTYSYASAYRNICS